MSNFTTRPPTPILGKGRYKQKEIWGGSSLCWETRHGSGSAYRQDRSLRCRAEWSPCTYRLAEAMLQPPPHPHSVARARPAKALAGRISSDHPRTRWRAAPPVNNTAQGGSRRDTAYGAHLSITHLPRFQSTMTTMPCSHLEDRQFLGDLQDAPLEARPQPCPGGAPDGLECSPNLAWHCAQAFTFEKKGRLLGPCAPWQDGRRKTESSTTALSRAALSWLTLSCTHGPQSSNCSPCSPGPPTSRACHSGPQCRMGSGAKATLGGTHLEEGHSCATAGSLNVFEEVRFVLKRDSHTGE